MPYLNCIVHDDEALGYNDTLRCPGLKTEYEKQYDNFIPEVKDDDYNYDYDNTSSKELNFDRDIPLGRLPKSKNIFLNRDIPPMFLNKDIAQKSKKLNNYIFLNRDDSALRQQEISDARELIKTRNDRVNYKQQFPREESLSSTPSSLVPAMERSKTPCRFWSEGRICQFGDNCRFAHSVQPMAPPLPPRPTSKPCRFGSTCRNKGCTFFHPPIENGAGQSTGGGGGGAGGAGGGAGGGGGGGF